jgi:cell wall-associated NlpC family hydrolase
MNPRLDTRAARVCTAVGALGALCTAASDAHAALSKAAVPASAAHWTAPENLLAGGPFGTPSAHRIPRISATARSITRMIRAGDRIARLPYVYGGGHGSFVADGYDCSGSVSYVLHAGGLLDVPEVSGSLESFGEPGPGRHVTIYANAGHAWMTINGRRFDTIAFQETGTRWSRTISSSAGYVVRHPRGY